ncbi:MAG: hypothetical protein ACRBB0_16005 [Pelagimonas sp.]|uniref:hypothetical protein n=1 Tax=Pelagimonas sp. TaxID=2073170 RepID=UPI003D6A02F6
MTLLQAFLNDTIDAQDFDQRAHVIVGFEILRSHTTKDATAIYARHLKALTIRAGAPEKFSAKITEHALSLIASRMSGDEDAAAFLDQNPDLLNSKSFRSD